MKVIQVLNQAKESLKILATFEKETFEKAKMWVRLPKVRIPSPQEGLLLGLTRVGLAPQSEVDQLNKKVLYLENLISSNASQGASLGAAPGALLNAKPKKKKKLKTK